MYVETIRQCAKITRQHSASRRHQANIWSRFMINTFLRLRTFDRKIVAVDKLTEVTYHAEARCNTYEQWNLSQSYESRRYHRVHGSFGKREKNTNPARRTVKYTYLSKTSKNARKSIHHHVTTRCKRKSSWNIFFLSLNAYCKYTIFVKVSSCTTRNFWNLWNWRKLL